MVTRPLHPECPDCGSQQYVLVAQVGRGHVRLECEQCRGTYLAPIEQVPEEVEDD